MNELKKIPRVLNKTKIKEMFPETTIRQMDEIIEKVQRFRRGKKYDKYLKNIDYKEFCYIVALLWNPNGYIEVLNNQQAKELQKEIEDFVSLYD